MRGREPTSSFVALTVCGATNKGKRRLTQSSYERDGERARVTHTINQAARACSEKEQKGESRERKKKRRKKRREKKGEADVNIKHQPPRSRGRRRS